MRLPVAACLCFVLSGAPLACHAQAADPEVEQHLRASRNLWINNEWVSAILEANEARSIAIKRQGPDSLDAAAAEYQRSFAAMQLNDAYVLPYLQHALAVREKLLPPDSPLIAEVLVQTGFYWKGKGGQPVLAIAPLRRALAIYRPGDQEFYYSLTLGYLADAYESSNQRKLALAAYQELAAIYEQKFGGNSNEFAFALRNQSRLQGQIGEQELARALDARASKIMAGLKQPEPPPQWALSQVAFHATRLMSEGHHREAEKLLRRAIGSEEAKSHFLGDIGRNQLEEAKLLLADVLVAGKRYGEAEPILAEALKSWNRDAGYNASKYLQTLLRALRFYAAQRRFADGDRIVAMIDQLYARKGQTPVDADASWVIDYYASQSRFIEALSWSRRVLQPIREQHAFDSPADADRILAEQKAARTALLRHLGVVRAGFPKAFESKPELLDEAFQVAQLARASNVGQNIAMMAARKPELGGRFAIRLREVQDDYSSLQADEANLSRLMVEAGGSEGASIARARRALEAKRDATRDKERALAAAYPKYSALVSQSPLTTAEVMALLHPDEALITYTVDVPATYVSVIRHDNGFFSITAGQALLDGMVRDLRGKLTSGELGRPVPMSANDGVPLFNAVFLGLDRALDGVRHVFVVPDGALQSLPFGALADSSGGHPDWLAKRYAFSYLPSVASLRALRTAESSSPSPDPFVGFGDPQLNDGRAAPTLSLGTVFHAGNRTRALADVEVLREAPSLPETADELRAVARMLGAPESAIHLRKDATETAVKGMDLSRYRILSFATHGVMAGELTEGTEPGLVLTPPLNATAHDDGYLGASEVAGLRLNAEWVLLSACNTAAPNGAPDAEGFSGLASAFLYAGSKSVLVSHWRVSSAATAELVSQAISRYASDPKASKAMALQRAMMDLMEKPEYSHPYYWSPFAVIGD